MATVDEIYRERVQPLRAEDQRKLVDLVSEGLEGSEGTEGSAGKEGERVHLADFI